MTQYNQPTSGQHVRIGNWYEELRLKEETGVRYFPSQQDKSKSLMTKERCITHTERIEPKDYKSTIQDTIIAPQAHPEYGWSQRKVGPREKMMHDKLQAIVDAEYNEKCRKESIDADKIDLSTESRSKYASDGFQSQGPKQGGSDRILKHIMTRDDPITIYSNAIKKNDNIPFPSTFVATTANPFAKNNAFTCNYSESYENPRHLPTVTDYQHLLSFKNRLLQNVRSIMNGRPGQAIRDIIGCLWSHSTSSDVISIIALTSLLKSQYGYDIMSQERCALLSAYGNNDHDSLSLVDLSGFFRRNMTGRRKQLVEYLYDMIKDDADDHILSIYHIKSRYFGNIEELLHDMMSIHRAMGSHDGVLTVDDFFDYYTDTSSEYDDENRFEELIVSLWNLE